jgi:hypothetical protein
MDGDTPWTRSLKAYTGQRKAAHRRCKSPAVPDSLCATCRAIDFEYFFFGDAATDLRRSVSEASCLGILAGVIERSKRGCMLCTSIISKQAQLILDSIHGSLARDQMFVFLAAKAIIHLLPIVNKYIFRDLFSAPSA